MNHLSASLRVRPSQCVSLVCDDHAPSSAAAAYMRGARARRSIRTHRRTLPKMPSSDRGHSYTNPAFENARRRANVKNNAKLAKAAAEKEAAQVALFKSYGVTYVPVV